MRFVFWAADKPREIAIGDALARCLTSRDWQFELRAADRYDSPVGDVGGVFGVKGISRQLLADYRAAGKHTLFFDKGHTRCKVGGEALWRVSVDGTMPLSSFQRERRPDDRARALGLSPAPRWFGDYVLFAGSSQKHCDFHGLGDCTAYARRVTEEIRAQTQKPLIYRPKPSWRDAVSIAGAEFSRPPVTLADELERCFVLVTFSSNAAVEAILAGVPAITLGPGIARPAASHRIADIDRPFWPAEAARRQWFADLAYCQWTVEEMGSGEMWNIVRPQLEP